MAYRYQKNHKFFPRLKSAYESGGISKVIASGLQQLFLRQPQHFLTYLYYRYFLSGRTFPYRGRQWRYFFHPYNRTYSNERCVEIAIACSIITQEANKRILEVGNVLSHYAKCDWDILDKFETGDRIINQDAADWQPQGKYDLIISISTLEHIGWGDDVRDGGKFLA